MLLIGQVAFCLLLLALGQTQLFGIVSLLLLLIYYPTTTNALIVLVGILFYLFFEQ